MGLRLSVDAARPFCWHAIHPDPSLTPTVAQALEAVKTENVKEGVLVIKRHLGQLSL